MMKVANKMRHISPRMITCGTLRRCKK